MSNTDLQRKVKTLADLVQENRAEFVRVIPKHLNADRILRIIQSALSRQPKLLQATPASVLRGVMQASILGLEVDTNGEAYLIPFDRNMKDGNTWRKVTEAQFIPGYRGLVKLARRSGLLDTINVKVVYEGDEFDWSEGSDPHVHHKPKSRMELTTEEELNKTITHAYMVAWLKGASRPQIEVMDRASILRIMARSKSINSSSSPWKTDFAEMARKCPVRRGSKYLPTESDFGRALAAEDRFDSGHSASDLFPEIPETMELPGGEQESSGGTVDEAAEVFSKAGLDKSNERVSFDTDGDREPKPST